MEGEAEKAGVSISKFVIEHMENSLKQEEGEEAHAPSVQLLKRLKEQEGEISRLTDDSRTLRLALERLDNLRIALNLQETVKSFNPRLMCLSVERLAASRLACPRLPNHLLGGQVCVDSPAVDALGLTPLRLRHR